MRASPHVAVPRTHSPHHRAPPSTLYRLAAPCQPSDDDFRDPCDSRARVRQGRIFCNAQRNGTPSERSSVGGSVDSARRRRLADSRRRSTSERTGAADSRGSPRLASSRLALPSAARLFTATCTRDSYLFAAADPSVFLVVFSFRLLMYMCVYVCARMCTCICLTTVTLRCRSPVVSLPPTRLASASRLCVPFSLFLLCSHHMRFFVRLVRLLPVECSTYV